MSSAFVKDSDDQWLDDIAPTMNALISFLSHENNDILVYEKKSYTNAETGKEVHQMSNGSSYSINSESKWYRVEEQE